MTKIKTKISVGAGLLLLAASCSTPKNVTYFQDLSEGQVVQAEKVLEIRVKPEDKLSIIVNTSDPALSVLFNLVQTSTQIQNTTSTTSQIGTVSTGGSNQISYYTVNPSGDITFPVLGKLHIAGMTRNEIAEYISKRLIDEDLVKDPIITVEFANTGITILGEVSSPGRYQFNKDRMSIIDAIGMAGDLSINGQRENILVLRPDGTGKEQAFYLNLTDVQSLYSSPAFYLQQNDVVYVAPNDKVIRETTPNGNTPFTPAFWVSLGSFGLTIATLLITLTD
jgi:polysaccharide export outer membrane protein